MLTQEGAILTGALLGVGAIGYYACTIWERSLKLQQQKLYVESAVRVIEVYLTQRVSTRPRL